MNKIILITMMATTIGCAQIQSLTMQQRIPTYVSVPCTPILDYNPTNRRRPTDTQADTRQDQYTQTQIQLNTEMFNLGTKYKNDKIFLMDQINDVYGHPELQQNLSCRRNNLDVEYYKKVDEIKDKMADLACTRVPNLLGCQHR